MLGTDSEMMEQSTVSNDNDESTDNRQDTLDDQTEEIVPFDAEIQYRDDKTR